MSLYSRLARARKQGQAINPDTSSSYEVRKKGFQCFYSQAMYLEPIMMGPAMPFFSIFVSYGLILEFSRAQLPPFSSFFAVACC